MNMYESGEILNGLYLYSYPANKSTKENTMNSLFVSNSDLIVSSGRYQRTLIAFPTNVSANRALGWCRKHNFGVAQSVQALRVICVKKGLKEIGKKFPKSFGSLAGTRAFIVMTEDLTVKK